MSVNRGRDSLDVLCVQLVQSLLQTYGGTTHPHFTVWKTEAQRSEVAHLMLHRGWGADLAFGFRTVNPKTKTFSLFRCWMERMYPRDDPRPSLSPMYLGSQKEKKSANTECLIYLRHELDSCKARSNPDVNTEFLISDLRSLSTHLSL